MLRVWGQNRTVYTNLLTAKKNKNGKCTGDVDGFLYACLHCSPFACENV